MDMIFLLGFIVMPILTAFATRAFYRRSVRRKRTNSAGALFIGNLLVLGFLLSTLCLVGELYFRFYYDSTDSFGLSKGTERWFRRHFRLNREGFRDSVDYHLRIPHGQHRITFLGDSFTAGHGVGDVEDRFANRIRNCNQDWDVHVIAACGWDSNAELQVMDQLLKQRYEIDVVVLVYCLNDVADIIPEWAVILNRIYNNSETALFIKHSYLFNTIYHRLYSFRHPDVFDYYAFVESGYDLPLWDIHKARMRSLRNTIHRSGGRLAVVTFPFLHSIGDDYKWTSVHTQLHQMWKSLNVPHLDLFPVFKNRTPGEVVVNSYDAHPNEFANELAAAAIDNFLKERFTTDTTGSLIRGAELQPLAP